MPNIGCLEERADAHAAYAHALLWYLTGNQANADKAIAIMNAYATTLRAHTMANSTLQTGWSISVMIRAAEIIRHSGAGWSNADIDRFSTMVRNVYVRDLTQTQGGVDGLISIFGNWALTIIEGITASGVFLDDHALFDRGLEMWRARFPSYVYLTADGALPVAPPDAKNASRAQLVAYWFGQGEFRDGVSAETCRDIEHLEYGLAAAANVAEIALKQGVDLYQEQQQRFIAMLEFHAPFVTGTGAPSWLCNGQFTRASAIETWEIAYNHFHNRRGMALPNTLTVVNAVRPTGAVSFHMAWESLTHAELGSR
ncbi:MAG TPA: alginate lyase family protein [Polyangia bacterium]|nr:alginate lyase family protein [Polyangia bacterium]